MPLIRFTDNIQRHVPCPPREVGGSTLHDALAEYFEANPRARGYILDEQGLPRKHIAMFINSRPIADRTGLSDIVTEDAKIDVMQALSGG